MVDYSETRDRGLEISDGIIEEDLSGYVAFEPEWKKVRETGWYLGRAHSCQKEWNKCKGPEIPKVVVCFGQAEQSGWKGRTVGESDRTQVQEVKECK